MSRAALLLVLVYAGCHRNEEAPRPALSSIRWAEPQPSSMDTLSVPQLALLWTESEPHVQHLLAGDSVAVSEGEIDRCGFSNDSVDIAGGALFEPSETHLMVRSCRPRPEDEVSLDHLFSVLHIRPDSTVEWVMTTRMDMSGRLLVRDTLRDVNGDGYRDRVITSYGGTGCCPRSHDRVFLYDAATQGFATPLDFLNAVYVPSEGLVRGMDYGHFGHAPFYTLRFTGLQVEEVECVYRTHEGLTPYEVGTCNPDGTRQGIQRLPEGYGVMEPYREWFEGE